MSAEQLITDHLDVWTSAVTYKSGRGAGKGRELTGIKKLRELILELAVRGKLVEQDPNDEPASVLLEKIAEEKARLVREGKISKSRRISSLADIEKPFDLPIGWQWTQIEHIGHDWGQKKPDQLFSYIDVTAIDNTKGEIRQPATINPDNSPSRARKHVKLNTVIYSTVRPYLQNIAVVEEEIKPEPIASTAFAIVSPLCGIPARFLLHYLRSPVFVSYVESVQTGIAYPAINDKQFFSGLLPTPPLQEQHRIVAKVDELMALCDRLEEKAGDQLDAHEVLVDTLLDALTRAENADKAAAQWARLAEHFDTLFTTEASIDKLKQAILQLAVMGRLVEQDPNDEPASVLLEKIAEEKARLVEEGEIKKQKLLSPIESNEYPFKIPEGWEISRMDDITHIKSGIAKGKKLNGKEAALTPYLRVANVQRGQLNLHEIKYMEIPYDELGKYTLEKRDLLITEGGDWDTVGRTAIWNAVIHPMAHQNHVFRAKLVVDEQNEHWIEKYLNSDFARLYFAKSSKQTTNLASINKTQLRSCTVPVPPLEEQKRIIAKLDELMALCDQLQTRLSDAGETRTHLAETVVAQAVH